MYLYLTNEQKKQSLEPLQTKINKLSNDLFLARVYKTNQCEIKEKLSILYRELDSLKKSNDIPIYDFSK